MPPSRKVCRIELHFDSELTNKLIELALSRIFKELVLSMVQTFTVRAKEVYSVSVN